jgi:hypothetical protein
MDLETSLMHDRELTRSTPRWVRITGIIVIAIVLLFASLHLVGRRLLGSAFGGHGDHAPHASATEHDPQPQ